MTKERTQIASGVAPSRRASAAPSRTPVLRRTPTGVAGLDEITGGGLPRGRPTLLCGGAGSGKTLLAMEFLVRGATQFDEPGVFMTFEEHADELATNFASLGYDLNALVKDKRIALDFVQVEPSEMEETGRYDLDGLFIRLQYAIDSIGAKRVVLDTVETLFAGLTNTGILRERSSSLTSGACVSRRTARGIPSSSRWRTRDLGSRRRIFRAFSRSSTR